MNLRDRALHADRASKIASLKTRIRINEEILINHGDRRRTDGIWVSELLFQLQAELEALEAQ